MSVYELNATNTMSEQSAVSKSAGTSPKGRSWGKLLLWIGVALIAAVALAGGGWLAYRAGQQAGSTGGATAVAAFGTGGMSPARTRPGMPADATGNGAAALGAVAAANTTAQAAAPAAQAAAPAAQAAGPAGQAAIPAEQSTAPAGQAAAVAVASGAGTGGLGSLGATAEALAQAGATQPAVTINTQSNALEQSATRTAATATVQAATASIPAIVATAATPLLSDTGVALASLDSGDTLRATARSADSQWLAVQSDAAIGWVERNAVIAYGIGNLAIRNPPVAVTSTAVKPAASIAAGAVTLVTTAPDAAGVATVATAPSASAGLPVSLQPGAVEATVTTSAANLNVRAGPGTEYAVVAKAAKGATLAPTARNAAADWLKVSTEAGESGWAAAAYLSVRGDVQDLPVEMSSAVSLPTTPAADNASGVGEAAAASSANSSTDTAAATSAAADLLSGTLAFQQSPGGTIWTYDFATGATLSLTNGFDPAISPDGSTVAFVREGGEAGLYLIDSDGSNERLIFGERGRLSAPKWSADGQRILFGRGDEYYECYPMGQNECLTEDEFERRFPNGAPFSVTLEKRYFDKLSVVDADGHNFRDIPSLTSAKAADWANGEIVYQSSAGLQRTADGTSDANQLIIFEPLMTQFQDPDWQPGGAEIAFQKKGAAQWDIWAVNADGSNMHGLTKALTTLVDTLPSNVAPAFSPDGAHIVYLSNRTESNEAGDWRLWVMDADGGNAHALPIDVPITYTFGVEQVVSWGG